MKKTERFTKISQLTTELAGMTDVESTEFKTTLGKINKLIELNIKDEKQTDDLKKQKQETNKFGANAEKFIDGIRDLLEKVEKIEGKLERHYYYHKKRDISPSSQGFDNDKDEIFGK